MSFKFTHKHKDFLYYSISLAGLLFVLHWLEVRLVVYGRSFELYVGLIALLFTALGIWLAAQLQQPKIETVVVEKEVYVDRPEAVTTEPGFCSVNKSLISQLGLSRRELEILALMAEGHSNAEIAEKLFVSVSTVKSHNQNLFEKLDVKRRIQAVEKAKKLQILP